MGHCEFQAVVLAAGRGSRMTDLTSGTPKCLLPVGGKPILCHALMTLKRAGFQDVIIIVPEDESAEIQKALTHNNVKINFELVSIPSDNEDWGTADSLRHLIAQDKIKNDVLLLSCDLFTNSNISKVLNTYRQHKASFAALFFVPLQCEPFQVPGIKSKYKPEKDIIGIDMQTLRLMFLASVSDFEETVRVSKNILRLHPRLNLRTDLIDGHLYVLSYNLALYLAAEKHFGTLKGEFLPYVVSKQHIRKNLGNEESSVKETTKKCLYEFMKESKLEENVIEMSAYNDHEGDLKQAYHGDVLKCYCVIADDGDFGIRINSLQALCQANRLCINDAGRVGDDIIGVKIQPSASVESSQIDSASFIGAGAKVKEKTSVKGSVIGDGCTINPKTRILQSILLKNVVVQEGCSLDNCIVANDVSLGSGCELKNCLVGPHYVVPDGTKANSQVLTKSEGLMEI